MGNAAKKLTPRAARYELQVKDYAVLRFASLPKGSEKFHTKIFNLSETGMAFLIPMKNVVSMGETIKVEFQAPNCDSIACFAKVVRIEIHTAWTGMQGPQKFKLVAIKFQDLPVKQSKAIHDGLNKQFTKQRRLYAVQQSLKQTQWLASAVATWPLKPIKKIKDLLKKEQAEATKRADRYIDED